MVSRLAVPSGLVFFVAFRMREKVLQRRPELSCVRFWRSDQRARNASTGECGLEDKRNVTHDPVEVQAKPKNILQSVPAKLRRLLIAARVWHKLL